MPIDGKRQPPRPMGGGLQKKIRGREAKPPVRGP